MSDYKKYLKWLKSLKDEQLKEFSEQVYADLEKASIEENNSEWHESCFAVMVVVAQEATRRGIKLR